mmetsp:Transcript_75596/g.130877  ORF Transcript_75596/g.130877 Transcript_75596/m.130877 type:complete len:243 (-) Transcript_75596:641-1369(-)
MPLVKFTVFPVFAGRWAAFVHIVCKNEQRYRAMYAASIGSSRITCLMKSSCAFVSSIRRFFWPRSVNAWNPSKGDGRQSIKSFRPHQSVDSGVSGSRGSPASIVATKLYVDAASEVNSEPKASSAACRSSASHRNTRAGGKRGYQRPVVLSVKSTPKPSHNRFKGTPKVLGGGTPRQLESSRCTSCGKRRRSSSRFFSSSGCKSAHRSSIVFTYCILDQSLVLMNAHDVHMKNLNPPVGCKM